MERWKNRGNERSDTQIFWLEFLQTVCDVESPTNLIEFEKHVALNHVSFIDCYIPSTCTIIEQKSRNVDLDKPQEQSDGTFLTPFEQAKRYYDWLPKSEKGNYIVVCNFREIRIHDMERPKAKPKIILLENLEKEAETFSFLIDSEEKLKKIEEAKRKAEESRKQAEARRQAEELKRQLEEAKIKVAEAQEQAEQTLKQLKVEEKLREILLRNQEEGPTDAQSQFDLGKKYSNDEKYEKAFYWYFRAAEQGHAEAQCEVAWRMDGQSALKWYSKAAEQGYAKAQYKLGCMYDDGYRVKKDYSEAFKWYSKAAEQGYVQAQYDLGLMVRREARKEEDYLEAIKFFFKAARQGSIEAQYQIGLTYEAYYKDWLKAVNWYRKVAQQGLTRAHYALGYMYKEGRGVKPNMLEAVYWWNLAVLSKDDYESKRALKHLYGLDDIEDEDYDVRPQVITQKLKEELKVIEKARRLIEKSKQNPEVVRNQFFELGKKYYSYSNYEDFKKAFYWYRKSAELGFSQAQYMLGNMYLNGQGVEQNYWEAIEYYHKAAIQEDNVAQDQLCEMCKKGIVSQAVISCGLMQKTN